MGFYSFLFIVAVVAFGTLFIRKYNLLQKQGHIIRESHSNVMVCMKKRVDLANRLIDIARSYGEHEKLTHITIAQSAITGEVNESSDLVTNESRLSRIVRQISDFPELKANQTYQQLMVQYNAIELDLQNKREQYNAAVRIYNSLMSQFPMILFAQSLGFQQAPYFNIDTADALANLKNFETDDGTLLRQRFAQMGTKVLDTSKAIGSQAMESGKALIEKHGGNTVSGNAALALCLHCSKTIQADARFCPNCGQPAPAVAAPSSEEPGNH